MYMYTPKHKDYACARVEDVNASFKDLCAVCDSVRGKNINDAVEYLELASEGKVAVYYRRHNTKLGHRRELGGKKGRWPMKECKIVLNLVYSAAANADQKGLSENDLIITHIAANKLRSYARMAPRGRWRRAFYETAFAEVVVEEQFEDEKDDVKVKDKKDKGTKTAKLGKEVKTVEKKTVKTDDKPKKTEAKVEKKIEAKVEKKEDKEIKKTEDNEKEIKPDKIKADSANSKEEEKR